MTRKKGGCGRGVTYTKTPEEEKSSLVSCCRENLTPINTWLPVCAGTASDRPVWGAAVQEENRGAVRM